jgi:hypothetical protein
MLLNGLRTDFLPVFRKGSRKNRLNATKFIKTCLNPRIQLYATLPSAMMKNVKMKKTMNNSGSADFLTY